MHDSISGGDESVIRAFRTAQEEATVLRVGGLDPEEARGRILRLANSVDRTLRRILRDDERADLSIRLRALAPDEISSESVLSELRRQERLPLDLAAAIHELWEVRRRLEPGRAPDAADVERAVAVVERLEPEVRRQPERTPIATPSAASAPLGSEAGIEGGLGDVVEVPRRRRSARAAGIPGVPLALGIGVLILILVGAWAISRRGPSEMEQGIAIFRTGAYAEAAQHFWRYAQEHPDEATPHLYLARIHRRMGRFELAADAIREAQRVAPEDPAVHRELGFLLLDTGEPDVAVERFEHAIELDRTSSEAWVGLVRALRDAGRADEVAGVIAEAPAEVRALLEQPATPS